MDKSTLSEDEIFMQKLQTIIQKINEAYYFTAGYNRSYEILIESLSEIRNISDFSEETEGILYFLRDSYNGDRNVIEELQKLLLKYRKRK
ncbi:hypothetical protein [Chryseobacterium sp. SC28]|uniref:hypothetical protein n=1 Tax=Chryseobacterium sp. SC28 TaxID=2268028 RepID=UPI000F64A0E4|nr:hypothetical protein [Chryseobacterium sp. SC28]RRQ46495.1 hypothetical protein DTW91_04770 [Chryseobacterium sp. SC28]